MIDDACEMVMAAAAAAIHCSDIIIVEGTPCIAVAILLMVNAMQVVMMWLIKLLIKYYKYYT